MLHATAMLAVQDGNAESAQEIIKGHCFATYGGDRMKLIELWEESFYIQEAVKLSRNLTALDKLKVRKRIGCIGDGSFKDSGCNRGPPNIGYPY